MDQEAGRKQEGIIVKKPRKRGGRPPQPPDIKRHYTMLSPEETEEVVDLVADLIVDFIKKKGVESLKDLPDVPGGVGKPEPEPPRDGRSRKGVKRQ